MIVGWLPSVNEVSTAAAAFPAGGHAVEMAIGVALAVGEAAGFAVLGPLQPASTTSATIARRLMRLETYVTPKRLWAYGGRVGRMKASPEVERWFKEKKLPGEPTIRKVREIILRGDKRMTDF